MNQQTALLREGSVSAAPDLDWSQVRETVKMLNLAIAQLGGSMINGDDSVSALTESFTFMAETITEICDGIEETENFENNEILSMIDQKCHALSDKVQSAIIAFQFYDRLSQNLSHVNESLAALGDLVGDQSKLYNPAEWNSLQQNIRSRYTMPQEREMFDLILNGATVAEVLACVSKKKEEQDSGEIELF